MASPVKVSGGKVNVAGVGSAPVIPLILGIAGAVVLWFAIHYWRDQEQEYPTSPIKDVLQGKKLPAPSRAPTAATLASQDASQFNSAGGSSSSKGSGTAPQGKIPAGSAQNIARMLLPKYGWGPDQMAPLIELWTRESSWDPEARNSSSGAFGIAQALGHGGSNTAAPDGTNEYGAEYGLTPAEARLANAGSARWQIEWGLGYIKNDPNYGTPAAAWAHEESAGWY